MSNLNLLGKEQLDYYYRLMKDRDYWKNKGYQYITLEESINGGYKVYLVRELHRSLLDQVIDYIVL